MEKTLLRTSALGETGLEITRVGFGAWAIGGGYDWDWGTQDDEDSIAIALVERLRAVADRHETSLGAVAVAWALSNPAVDGAIVGFRGPDQVDPIIGAANLELGEDDLATIEGSA